MDPVERDDHNFTYKGEHETEDGKVANLGVGDLSCRVEDSYTFAHFLPTERDLEILNQGGVIEVHVVGHPLPPLGLDAVTRQPEADLGSQNGNAT